MAPASWKRENKAPVKGQQQPAGSTRNRRGLLRSCPPPTKRFLLLPGEASPNGLYLLSVSMGLCLSVFPVSLSPRSLCLYGPLSVSLCGPLGRSPPYRSVSNRGRGQAAATMCSAATAASAPAAVASPWYLSSSKRLRPRGHTAIEPAVCTPECSSSIGDHSPTAAAFGSVYKRNQIQLPAA